MSLSSELAQRLRAEASRFQTENHVQYLSDAISAVRRGLFEGAQDPGLEALRLLVAMWRSGYASRTGPKRALNDVGQWLEKRLRHDTAPKDLLLQLIWMKRLTAANAKFVKQQSLRVEGREQPRRAFGDRMEQIERDRRRRRQKKEEARLRSVVVEVVQPKELPDSFSVEFQDLNQARQANRNYRTRLKKKKAPKDVALSLRPVDEMLRPLAEGLYLNTIGTDGVVDVFEAINKKGGKVVAFWVDGLERTDAGIRAVRVRP